MADLSPTATLALHYRCVPCAGGGYVNQDGRAARCGECNGRGTWEEPVTLAELAVWVDNHLGARQVAAAGLGEIEVREIVREEVKRAMPSSVKAGKKGGR